MSISSDIKFTRQKALEMVFEQIIRQQEDLIRKAVNAMSNDELADQLHDPYNFVHVTGEGKLKERWE